MWGRPWPTLWPTLWPTGGQFFKTRLSITVNPCKQLAPWICHTYDSPASVLLATFRSNFLHRLVADRNQRNQNAVYNTSFGELSYEGAIVVEHLSRTSEFQRENMKPFSIKRIIFIVVETMGRCIQYYILVVITYFTHLASENSLVIASKQGFREVTETDPVCTEWTGLSALKFVRGAL